MLAANESTAGDDDEDSGDMIARVRHRHRTAATTSNVVHDDDWPWEWWRRSYYALMRLIKLDRTVTSRKTRSNGVSQARLAIDCC
jgi:hypothetical protein